MPAATPDRRSFLAAVLGVLAFPAAALARPLRRPRRPTRPQPRRPRRRLLPRRRVRVGDTVLHAGHRWRVTAVNPDGSFRARAAFSRTEPHASAEPIRCVGMLTLLGGDGDDQLMIATIAADADYVAEAPAAIRFTNGSTLRISGRDGDRLVAAS